MSSIFMLRAKELADPFIQTKNWIASDFSPPSPSFVKRRILAREGIAEGAWIETGTYLGGTTKALARISPEVISIEPSEWLHGHASRRLSKHKNITLLNGTSEDKLDTAITAIKSKKLNLWLDGHYSAGATYQGKNETPIMRELEVVAKHLPRFQNVAIFIDDIRCFTPGKYRDSNYPLLGVLPAWCEQNQATWKIEHDIFIARHEPA
jgi:hypothetical protein